MINGRGGQQSRVLNALALLVESGTIYCFLLVSRVSTERTPARSCPRGKEKKAKSMPLIVPSSDDSRNHRRGEQTIVIAYQVTPAVFPTPGGVHQNAFLRAIAVYTCACFIPVIVST